MAQAVALAAKQLGIPAYIVMPSNAPSVKKQAVITYGGIITECEPTIKAREHHAQKIRCGILACLCIYHADSRSYPRGSGPG